MTRDHHATPQNQKTMRNSASLTRGRTRTRPSRTALLLSVSLAVASATPTPAATVIGTGHADIGIGYKAGAWDMYIHKELPAPEEEFEPGGALLHVNQLARTTIPDNPAFGFLGTAGGNIWVLPKDADPNQLLFLGIGSEELDPADWSSNLTLTLKAVQGPGEFFVWDIDSLGQPAVLMNTRDGVSPRDQLTAIPGSHGHYFYGFTSPGTYRVTVAAGGTRKDTGFSTSGDATYTFVVEPARLTNAHADIQVVDQPATTNRLAIVVSDDDHRVRYAANEVVLVVPEAAKVTLPAGTPLGLEGAPMWILPQSQNPELLYLGLSAEGMPQGVFTGNLDLRLKAVDGPGDFLAWQSDLGGLNLRLDSRDRINERDHADLIVGSHAHLNWGFTTNGVYRITFQAAGRRVGETTNTVSLDTTLTFHVLPFPEPPPAADPGHLAVRQLAVNGDLEIEVAGTAGAPYQVETSADLKEWKWVKTVTLRSGSVVVTVPTSAARQFIRATTP